MTMIRWVALTIGAGALVLPAWLVAGQPRTPRLRHAQIQALADAGCRCARRLGDVPGVDHCWDRFEARTRLLVANAGESACFPLSERSFWESGREQAIVLNYNIAGGPKFAFCSKNEAMAAEALWYRIALSTPDIYSPEGIEAQNQANAALRDFARQVAANAPIEATQSQGCVGGIPSGD